MEKNVTHSQPDEQWHQASGMYGTYEPPHEYHISTPTDSMHPVLNPDEDKIQGLISLSEQKAAKWIKDLDTGDLWYWPASWVTHANMAAGLGIKEYDKGIVVGS